MTDHLWQTTQVVVFDLDQDGDLDLIGSELSGSRVVWWLNDGEGNFGFGKEWMWEGNVAADTLDLRDFDGDGYLEVMLSAGGHDDFKPGDLFVAEWRLGSFSSPELVGSLDIDYEFYRLKVTHLNDDGVPDFVGEQEIFLSDPGFEYEIVQRPEFGWFSTANIGEVDDDDIREIFNIGDDNEVIRYDLSRTGPMLSQVIARISDDESLEAIVFHPVSKDIISFSMKHLTEGQGLPIEEEEYEMIIRAHPSDGDVDTVPIVIERRAFIGGRTRYIVFNSNDEDGRVYGNDFVYDREDLRHKASYFEVVFEDNEYRIVPFLESDYFIYESPPLFREINGDELIDLVLPFSSWPRVTGSFVDQLAWIPGNGSGDWSSGDLRPISSEGLIHEFKYFGDVDGDGDNDFITQVTESYNDKRRGFVVVWENDGAGNFEMHKVLAEPYDVYGRFEVIRAFDIAGSKNWLSEVPNVSNEWPEGRLDFLVSFQSFPGNSWGGFVGSSYPRYLLQDSEGGFYFSDVAASPSENLYDGFSLFDWNRDGSDELLAFSYVPHEMAQVHLASFEGMELKEFSPIGPEIRHLKIVDLDQDGFFDLVSSDQWSFDSDSHWYRNDGSDVFLEAEALSYSLRPAGYDLDGDGYEDFIGWNEDRSTFVVPGALKEGAIFDGDPRPFQIGSFDIDGDGDLDRFYDGFVGGSSIFLRFAWDETLEVDSVEGLVTRRHSVSTGAHRHGPAYQETKGFGDIDGDGTPDLLSVSSNRVEWFKMTQIEQPAVFSNWMASKGVTGHSASLTIDHDFDGRSNWEEFVFGSHPALRERNPSSTPGVRMGVDGLEFSFLFRSDADELGISRSHLRSGDMENWIPMNEDPLITPEGGEYERVTYPLTPEIRREFFQTTISPPAE